MSKNIKDYAIRVTDTPFYLRRQLHKCLLDNDEKIWSGTKFFKEENYPDDDYARYLEYDGCDWCGDDTPGTNKKRVTIEEFLKLFDKSSFKVGNKVYCPSAGIGKVIEVRNPDYSYPVIVEWISGKHIGQTYSFTLDGYNNHSNKTEDTKITLYTESAYKVGDKVIIRSDLKNQGKYNMFTELDDNLDSCYCNEVMTQYKGQTATIVRYSASGHCFYLDIDDARWSWVDEMFEGLANTDAAQVVQEEVQMKYKIGDKFVNSSGNTVTIVDIENIRTKEYKYKVGTGRVFTVAEESIDRNWKLIQPTNTPLQIGMKIKVRSDLKDQDYYNVTGDTSLKMRPNLDMLTKKGQEVTIADVIINPSNTQQYYYIVEGLLTKKWSDEMFDLQVKVASTDASSVAGTAIIVHGDIATNIVAPKIQNKGLTMPKRTIAENAGVQLQEVKVASINAAELKAGQIINAQVIKLVKPKLPMMLRGYADSPVASVVLANVVGIALKQYAPDNAKLAKLSSLMLNAAALDAVDAFNIDGLVDDLLAGVKLPAGVSLDADA